MTMCQFTLLDREGIDGFTDFTDFTVYGTAFVNRRWLTDDHGSGLPGRIRPAEALVREG
ncbi:hypothetical protein ACFRMQ_00915 [Kitasatospora sp. NPDC056783]|uniref:hypothetical protein n=1 Tax=Kitasatospora sp. NPDC056783 TaxID=3345943 RepID=UPI0036A71452